MAMQYDVIVVGAGPAGCAAAYDLAASGRRVLLFDRRRFPRVKACAGGLTVKTLRRLRYPVTPVVRHVCAGLTTSHEAGAGGRLPASRPLCAMTVRAELDEFCLQRTIERGACFEVVPHITGITENERGVAVETTGGVLRGRYLIGADGANSVVRRHVSSLPPVLGFAIEACVRTGRPAEMALDFGVVERGYGWLFPKGDHLNVGLFTASLRARPGRRELGAYARARLGPLPLEEVAGHHIGLGGGRAPPATVRIVLVGDAAGLVDPLLGEGIHNAVASGQAAAAAVADADAGRASFARAYARRLRAVRADLRVAQLVASAFYANPRIGHRLLTSWPARHALLLAYGRGFTISAFSATAPPPAAFMRIDAPSHAFERE